MTELIDHIRADQKIYQYIDEPFSINIFNGGSGDGKSTMNVNGQFVFFQVLIDCLLRLKVDATDRKELIDQLKIQYNGNSLELSFINEFQKSYSSNKALWWYTRQTFFYKALNSALRHQNVHYMFLFREFINDMRHQLKACQTRDTVKVYRGQVMSLEELKTLQGCCGQLISVNSFFSTSNRKKTALSFLKSRRTTDNLVPILFEINANPNMVNEKPFADITAHTDFPDESETLFMPGSIFHVDNIEQSNNNSIWIARMTLSSDHEHGLKKVLMDMKEQLGDGETDLEKLGKLLWEIGQLNLAEVYLIRFFQNLPPNHPSCYQVCQDLGKLTSQAGDLEKSMIWRQKAIDIKSQKQQDSSPRLDTTSDSKRKFNCSLCYVEN